MHPNEKYVLVYENQSGGALRAYYRLCGTFGGEADPKPGTEEVEAFDNSFASRGREAYYQHVLPLVSMDALGDSKSEDALTRVRLAYESADGERLELPFVVGVLGNFSGNQRRHREWRLRSALSVSPDTFDAAIASLGPVLNLSVQPSGCGRVELNVSVRSLRDLDPDRLVDRDEHLRSLRDSGSAADQEILASLLNGILRSSDFREMEAAWRGLNHLVSHVGADPLVRIDVIDVSREELLSDLSSVSDIQDSVLCAKLYREPYGTLGMAPYSLFVGIFDFAPCQADMRLWTGIAAVARKCLAPFLASAGKQMSNLNTVDVQTHSAPWDNFRGTEDARFLGLTLPRVLLRRPYRDLYITDSRTFIETGSEDDLLWGSSAIVLAAAIIESFTHDGWFDGFLGEEDKSSIDLPTRAFVDKAGLATPTCLEFRLAENAAQRLEELGFIPLMMADHGMPFFIRVPTCQHKPVPGSTTGRAAEAWARNARLHAQLPYLLACGRLMHCLMVMGRDLPSRAVTDWQRCFQSWVFQFVHLSGGAVDPSNAARPFRACVIHVEHAPCGPGKFHLTAFMLPEYKRLCAPTVEIRLTAEFSTLSDESGGPGNVTESS